MESLVSKEDIVSAELAIRLVWSEWKMMQAVRMSIPPSMYRMDRELYEMYMLVAEEYLVPKVSKSAEQMGKEMASRYYHVAYAVAQPLISPLSALAFVAFPPQVTAKPWGPVLKTGSYISCGFIPTKLRTGKIVRNLITRFWYRNYYFSAVRMNGIERHIAKRFPRLYEVYRRKLEQYGGGARARRLAARDVARVLIGNVWLVQMYYLLRDRKIGRHDIVLPYELASSPENAKLYVDPAHTVYEHMLPDEMKDEIRDITWTWLVEEVSLHS